MAISVGTTAQGTNATSQSVTVDAGSDRLFVALISQGRTPLNLTNDATLNAVSPTGVIRYDVSTFSGDGLLLAYWLDADMPAAGSQTLAFTGTATGNLVAYLNASGVSQSAPEATDTTDNVGSNSGSFSATLSASSGALVISGSRILGAGAFSATSGTNITSGTGSWLVYTTASGTVSGTLSPSDQWIQASASFSESGAATTYPQNRGRLIGTGTIGQGNGFGYKRF